MEAKESIYEEIMTRESPEILNEDVSQGMDTVSETCQIHEEEEPVSNKLQQNKFANDSIDHQDDSLYAVVNGNDLEFKRLKDLLETEQRSSRKELKFDDSETIAQVTRPSNIDEKDFGENDSGCDCSQTSKELGDLAKTTRPTELNLPAMSETVYSEILHLSPASEIDLTPGRLTRESNNPILRQEVISSNSPSPSTSKPPSRSGSFRRSRNGDSTRSASGDSGIQEDLSAAVLYGNCTPRRPLSRHSSAKQMYVNAVTSNNQNNQSETVYENTDNNDKMKDENTVVDEQTVYENVDDEEPRPRAASRPITIQPTQRKRSPPRNEVLYSDLDFGEEITESLSSSPGDGSNISLFSSPISNPQNSCSPPPLPNRPTSVYSRRRFTSFTSVSMSSYQAGNGVKAHFIGSHTVQRATTDNIDAAIKETVNKTNILDITSVSVDMRKHTMQFVRQVPPYDCILQISADDVHILGKYSKDVRFFGVIVSKPGKDAICHVLQSDQSAEIIEMVKDVFREGQMRSRHSSPERPKSLYGVSEVSHHNSFFDIINVGSLKVKQKYLVINDSIALLLEKINPKDYRLVNINIQENAIILSNPATGVNIEQHSVPWILSLGLYSKDNRFFGYIVSNTKNGKTRMFCHVFRCTRIGTSASLLEGIRSVCQSTLMHNQILPRTSSSLPRSVLSNRPKIVPPDVISRSSTSSEETMMSQETISSSHRGMHQSNHAEDSPKFSRNDKTASVELHSFQQEESTEQNAIYCNTSPQHTETNQKQDCDVEVSPKEKKGHLFKGKSKLFRGTLNRKKNSSSKLSSSMHSLNITPIDDKEMITPVERKEYKFIVSYLCSAVVSPPLKPKHVGNCFKQYQKEVGKKVKSTEKKEIGKILLLYLVTDEGVTMADIQNPDAFRRHFPIASIDDFVMHPDNPDCFAFSTTVAGDGQRKYHVFYKAKENVSLIKSAFDLLKQTQRAM